jgi:sporulation protein YlmC with PRC-barrel domain
MRNFAMKRTEIASSLGIAVPIRTSFTAAALALLLASGIVLPMTIPAHSQPVVVVDVKAVAQGYRASKLAGTPVQNNTGEEIGKIDDLIVDKEKVLYAIVQVGGFLGLGGYLIAVPYNSLNISPDGKKIVLTQGGSKAELQKTPEFKYPPNQ